jgi:hypothetical protein
MDVVWPWKTVLKSSIVAWNLCPQVISARHIRQLVNLDASLPSPAPSPSRLAAATGGTGSAGGNTQAGPGTHTPVPTQGGPVPAQGTTGGVAPAHTAGVLHGPTSAAGAGGGEGGGGVAAAGPSIPAYVPPEGAASIASLVATSQATTQAGQQQQTPPPPPPVPPARPPSTTITPLQEHQHQQDVVPVPITALSAPTPLPAVLLKPPLPLASLTLGSVVATAGGAVLDDACIAQLTPVSQTLKSLSLTCYLGTFTGSGAPAALAALTGLTNLELHGATGLGDAGLAVLWRSGVMSRLHSFSLSHTSSSVTPDGLLQMLGNRAGIPPCIVCICGRDHGHSVGTAGNAAIVHTTCPSLTSLTLSMCGMAVTDRVLTAVAAASPRLAQLACVQATNVSDYGVRAVASLPRLALLDLSLCQRTTGVCFGVGRQGGGREGYTQAGALQH